MLVRDDDQLQKVTPAFYFNSFNLHFTEFLAALPGFDQQVVAQRFNLDASIGFSETVRLLSLS